MNGTVGRVPVVWILAAACSADFQPGDLPGSGGQASSAASGDATGMSSVGQTHGSSGVGGSCAASTTAMTTSASSGSGGQLPVSCLEIGAVEGPAMIDVDGAGPNPPVQTHCAGGFTLVFVGRGKMWHKRHLVTSYVSKLSRDDLTQGVHEVAEYLALEHWPSYAETYYERWLPESLVGRAYAAPGWARRIAHPIASRPVNLNFWSATRMSEQGFQFDLQCPTIANEALDRQACEAVPLGGRIRHVVQCNGCLSGYLWFQQPECRWALNAGGFWTGCGSWNGFFPDSTYSHWRISNLADFDKHWPEYEALSEGQPMPGYGLYVR